MSSIDFGKIFEEATGEGLKLESPWYIYAATTIEGTGSPTAAPVGDLWKYIASEVKDEAQLLKYARRIREGLLKCSVLVGFPRGINALSALSAAIKETNPEVSETLSKDKSLRSELSADQLNKRGQKFFEDVYSTKTEKVQGNMAKTSGGDLDQFAILSVYGELMAETRIVNEKETGLMEFLACYAMGAAPQANGHMYGSRNLGNSKDEIQTGIKVVRAVVAAMGLKPDFDSLDAIAKKMDKW